MSYAYMTTLCSGDAYLPGVEVLGRSLDASGTQIPKVVLATRDVTESARKRLAALAWQVRPIEPIANPSATNPLFARFGPVFAKLRAWEQTDFDRIVALDADTLVLQNIDDLFARPGFAAAPDFFLPDRFNSGVMVLEPSLEVARKMRDSLAVSGSYDGGDQGFLNEFYPDWYTMPVEHRLPVGYNMANFIYQFLRAHPTLKARLESETKVVHYLVQKPWQARAVLTGGAAAWWQRYFEVHPAANWPGGDALHAAEDWTFEHLAALALE